VDLKLKNYSSGMLVRLAFAVMIQVDADILLIDEVLAVGDEAFQRKCERRIAEHVARGTTLVLVSHDAALVDRTCERLIVLDGGQVVFDGPTVEGMPFYHRLMGTEGAPEEVQT
jgi:ABC-type polysaccharide/polyol phosphate transport system ATPase subunit